ncbi:hypothetical protein [Candidatus Deianiraea vastatrix]|uniref:Uncharacterized protein n=1 Tax=Candidatus Deianiraea vastatrix TaxID=2163644 RepID=A0A5B8XEE3_9RICK|nr:hypothetical protein [Candidatus Deianiraea vastatrix]QED23643.1 hypothetical protein Deia_00856 [Candidatus Deianiraea vastatrix]
MDQNNNQSNSVVLYTKESLKDREINDGIKILKSAGKTIAQEIPDDFSSDDVNKIIQQYQQQGVNKVYFISQMLSNETNKMLEFLESNKNEHLRFMFISCNIFREMSDLFDITNVKIPYNSVYTGCNVSMTNNPLRLPANADIVQILFDHNKKDKIFQLKGNVNDIIHGKIAQLLKEKQDLKNENKILSETGQQNKQNAEVVNLKIVAIQECIDKLQSISNLILEGKVPKDPQYSARKFIPYRPYLGGKNIQSILSTKFYQNVEEVSNKSNTRNSLTGGGLVI